jgi:hypothetical protein
MIVSSASTHKTCLSAYDFRDKSNLYMSKEKIVFSIIAILLGLLVAGGAFYIYQVTRTINEPNAIKNTIVEKRPTPVPQNSNFLVIQEPKDEQVFTKRILNITGKTAPDATIIVSTQSLDQVVEPSKNGDFSLTLTLDDGVNILKTTAIFNNGEEKSITRTVTSTTEDF